VDLEANPSGSGSLPDEPSAAPNLIDASAAAEAAAEADEAQIELQYNDRMTDTDALMWAIEKDPMLRSTITSVLVIDGTIERDDVWRVFNRASRVVPRLRQRVSSSPLSAAPPRWEIDANFDLGYHVRFARAAGKGELADVLDMARPIAMQGFDRARPLWECTIVEGLADDQSALIIKMHHSITDGIGAVNLLLELFDLDPEAPQRAMPEAPPADVMHPLVGFVDSLNHERRRQTGILSRLASDAVVGVRQVMADPVGTFNATTEMVASAGRLLTPAPNPRSPIMTGRSLSIHLDTITLPLAATKKAARTIGGTINDAFVSGVARGVQRYHLDHGTNVGRLRVGMPINTRDPSGVSVVGNDWVPARFDVPVESNDPADFMREIHDHLVSAREEPANQLVGPMSNVLNRLPTTVVTQIFGSMMKGLDFQASNVPGSPVPIYLLGSRITAVIPFGPLAGAGLNVTLLSYCDDLNLGVNIDVAAVPDPEFMVEHIRAAFAELLALGD